MFRQLLQQLKVFSRENWWIYILLCITITLVFITGKGDSLEITLLFTVNLLGAMFNMLMMNAYKNKNFMEGSVFIVIANMLYTFLSLYAWFYNGDMQYIFWQTSFLLTGIKAFMLYTYKINIKFINFYSILLLNIAVMYVLVQYVEISTFVIIQSLGIALVTLGLALQHDEYRYFFILFGNLFLVIGSILILWLNYISGNILGITVAYTLLGLSTFVYYTKLLPTYIIRFKEL